MSDFEVLPEPTLEVISIDNFPCEGAVDMLDPFAVESNPVRANEDNTNFGIQHTSLGVILDAFMVCDISGASEDESNEGAPKIIFTDASSRIGGPGEILQFGDFQTHTARQEWKFKARDGTTVGIKPSNAILTIYPNQGTEGPSIYSYRDLTDQRRVNNRGIKEFSFETSGRLSKDDVENMGSDNDYRCSSQGWVYPNVYTGTLSLVLRPRGEKTSKSSGGKRKKKGGKPDAFDGTSKKSRRTTS